MDSFQWWSGAVPKSSIQRMLLCRVFEKSPTATTTSETTDIASDRTNGKDDERRRHRRQKEEEENSRGKREEGRGAKYGTTARSPLRRLFVGGGREGGRRGERTNQRTKTQNGNLQRHLSLSPILAAESIARFREKRAALRGMSPARPQVYYVRSYVHLSISPEFSISADVDHHNFPESIGESLPLSLCLALLRENHFFSLSLGGAI